MRERQGRRVAAEEDDPRHRVERHRRETAEPRAEIALALHDQRQAVATRQRCHPAVGEQTIGRQREGNLRRETLAGILDERAVEVGGAGRAERRHQTSLHHAGDRLTDEHHDEGSRVGTGGVDAVLYPALTGGASSHTERDSAARELPMDYAVIRSGGKQYRVHPGETIRLEKLPAEPGAGFVFTDVLLTSSDGGLQGRQAPARRRARDAARSCVTRRPRRSSCSRRSDARTTVAARVTASTSRSSA